MIGYSVMEIALGVDAPVSLELLRQIVVGVALDTVVALPVWALVHRWLAPSLPDDPRQRGSRRAYTTGGLSPLSASDPHDPHSPGQRVGRARVVEAVR